MPCGTACHVLSGFPLAVCNTFVQMHFSLLWCLTKKKKKFLESLSLLLCWLFIHHCGEVDERKKKPTWTDYMHVMKILLVHRDLFGGPHLSPIASFLCVFGETWLQVCHHFARVNRVSFVCSRAGRGAGPLAKQLQHMRL